MGNSYGFGTALCNYPESGSSGTDVKILDSINAPQTALVQAVAWTGIGDLTLKTHNGNTFYTCTQASGSSTPVAVAANNLTVTTPILYTISGADKGTIVLFGHFI